MAKIIAASRLRNYWKVYFFVIPSALIVALFCYYPAVEAIVRSFYRWNGQDISKFVGMSNFSKAMGNYWLWFITGILLVLVLFFAKSDDKKSNIFRLLGSFGSLIAGLGLLVSQGYIFEAKDFQLNSNSLLFSVIFWGALMLVSKFCLSEDNANKWIYQLVFANFLCVGVLKAIGLESILSWMVILLSSGIFLWLVPFAKKLRSIEGVRTFHAFWALGICFWGLGRYSGGDATLWSGFTVISILVLFNIPKMFPSIITAVVINRLKSDKANYIYKVLFVVPMIIPGMVYLLLWKFFFDPNIGIFNRLLVYSKVMDLLVFIDKTFLHINAFSDTAPPVWLGNEHLVLPALILWGFPWVGIVGVLIYLAGLQSIPESVYEAADLDGASAIQKFIHIEMPLILTQVRINLVMMIIGTLKTFAFILILFGEDGGPNGRLMVPGLFMFKQAFSSTQAGYACAIGLVIFFFILLLTEFNNRYVRVEK